MTTHDPIPARLAALKTMQTSALKEQWRDLFDSEPPPFNRRYLESRLAYRIQEPAYGGLKPETIRRLERLDRTTAMLLCRVKVEFGVFEESPDAAGDEAFEAADGVSFGFAFAGSSGDVVLGCWAAALPGQPPGPRSSWRSTHRAAERTGPYPPAPAP